MQIIIQLQIFSKVYPEYNKAIENANILKEKIRQYKKVKNREKLIIEELDKIQDKINLFIHSILEYI